MDSSAQSVTSGTATPDTMSEVSNVDADEIREQAMQMSYDDTHMDDVNEFQALKDLDAVKSTHTSKISELQGQYPPGSGNYTLLAGLDRCHQVSIEGKRRKILDSIKARSADSAAEAASVENTQNQFDRMALNSQGESSNRSGFPPPASNFESREQVDAALQALGFISHGINVAAHQTQEPHQHDYSLIVAGNRSGLAGFSVDKDTCFLGSLDNEVVVDVEGQTLTRPLGKPCERTSFATRTEDGKVRILKRTGTVPQNDYWRRLPEGTDMHFDGGVDQTETLMSILGQLSANQWG